MATHTLRRQINAIFMSTLNQQVKRLISIIIDEHNNEKYIPLCLTKVASETTEPNKRMLTKYNSFKSGRGYRLKKLTATEEKCRFRV